MPAVDFAKLRKPQKSYLKEIKEDDNTSSRSTSQSKGSKASKVQKVGRPMTENEPLNVKLTLNFTATEMKVLKNKAGLISVATFVRSIIKNSGILN